MFIVLPVLVVPVLTALFIRLGRGWRESLLFAAVTCGVALIAMTELLSPGHPLDAERQRRLLRHHHPAAEPHEPRRRVRAAACAASERVGLLRQPRAVVRHDRELGGGVIDRARAGLKRPRAGAGGGGLPD